MIKINDEWGVYNLYDIGTVYWWKHLTCQTPKEFGFQSRVDPYHPSKKYTYVGCHNCVAYVPQDVVDKALFITGHDLED